MEWCRVELWRGWLQVVVVSEGVLVVERVLLSATSMSRSKPVDGPILCFVERDEMKTELKFKNSLYLNLLIRPLPWLHFQINRKFENAPATEATTSHQDFSHKLMSLERFKRRFS